MINWTAKIAEYRKQMERGSPVGISGKAFSSLLDYIAIIEADRDKFFELVTRARCRTPHAITPEEIASAFGSTRETEGDANE
jgi:hypothetical protein